MRPSDKIATAFIILGTILIALAIIIPTAAWMSVRNDWHAQSYTILRIGVLEPVDSLSPFIGLTKTSSLFYSLVYDGLQSLDENLEAVPNLAVGCYPVPTTDAEMQASGAPYGSVWQYNLTTNAQWSDGEPFTADDVVWNINFNALNYEAMWDNQQFSYFMKDAVKTDASAVRVHFYDRATGTPMPVSYAYMISMPMLPKHMMEGMNAFDISFNWSGVFPESDMPIIGTGPFMVNRDIRDEWLSGDRLTLVRNPNYHAEEDRGLEAQIDKIQICVYDDPVAMRLALLNNQVDVARFPHEVFSTIINDSQAGRSKHVTTFQGLGPAQDLVYLSWLMGTSYWGGDGPNRARLDPEIRTALAMATNRSYVVEEFFNGFAEEATTITSPINELWHYEPTQDELIPYNIERANQVLEDAGYVHMDGDDVRECTNASYAVQKGLVSEGTKLSFSMAVPMGDTPGSEDIAQYIDAEWARVGVDLNIVILNPEVLTLCPYAEDVGLITRSGSLDPNEILFTQSKRAVNGWSDTGYSSVLYDKSYNRSVTSMYYQDRKAAVDECQRIHYLDLPYQNLVYPYQLYAWSNHSLLGWGNWSEHPGLSLENTWGANPLLFDLVPVSRVYYLESLYPIAYTVAIACGVSGLALLGLGLRRQRIRSAL